MPYKKGESGNPSGRKVGSKNKRTLAIERGLKAKIEDVDNVLSSYLSGEGSEHSLSEDFNSSELTPRDRLMIAEKLMTYRFPKMQSTAVDLTTTTDSSRSIAERLRVLSEPAK